MTDLKRREFLKSLGLLSTAGMAALSMPFGLSSCSNKPSVNKREAVFNLIAGETNTDYIPTGFFMHFGEDFQYGDAAVAKHLEYFNAIDMDFIKIQYETLFPELENIKKPEDWANMHYYGKEFYEKQLYVVKELVKQGKPHAPVIATYYSPFMCAGHTATNELLNEHMQQDPESVQKGMDIITESVLYFVKECKKLGVDGFLAPTQGNESNRFDDPNIFLDYIKPADLVVMNEINDGCECNVLHICDYNGPYDDVSTFIDYPGHIVNMSDMVAGERIPLTELYDMFGQRPIMGGLEKRGPILDGSKAEISAEVTKVLNTAPEKFILGAECALLGEVQMAKVRKAVDVAHGS